MRIDRLRVALVAALAVLGANCQTKRLTGPAAQRAFREARPTFAEVPEGTLIFVNGLQVPIGRAVDRLDPATITSVEIMKVADGKGGTIYITTTDSARVAQLIRP